MLLPTLLLDDVLSATEGINGSEEAESGAISVVVVIVNDLINVPYGIIVSARVTTCCVLDLRAEVGLVLQQGSLANWCC